MEFTFLSIVFTGAIEVQITIKNQLQVQEIVLKMVKQDHTILIQCHKYGFWREEKLHEIEDKINFLFLQLLKTLVIK